MHRFGPVIKSRVIFVTLVSTVLGKGMDMGDYDSKLHDLGERKVSERERAALFERLELATKSSGVGVWEWDLATDHLIWNAQMFELTGISPEVKPEYGMFIELIDANHR